MLYRQHSADETQGGTRQLVHSKLRFSTGRDQKSRISPIASIHAVDKDPEWSIDAVAGLARGTSIENHAIHRRG